MSMRIEAGRSLKASGAVERNRGTGCVDSGEGDRTGMLEEQRRGSRDPR